MAHKNVSPSIELKSKLVYNKILSNRTLTTVFASFYYLISFSLGKMSLGSFLLFSACYYHINVLIFHFLQYCITFFFLFKICTGPVSLKMDKSPKLFASALKNIGGLN